MKKAHPIYSILGLRETEIAVMIALSDPKSVQDIAKQSGISRTGINYCLSSLLHRGLVKVVRAGYIKKYSALTDNEILEKLQNHIDSLKTNSDKKGVNVKTSKNDSFTVHVGLSEIIPAYERIAYENKNERIKAIQHHNSYNELLKKISQKQLIAFNDALIKNRIIVEGILNESAYNTYKEKIKSNPQKYKKEAESLEGRMADYAFFSDSKFNSNAEIWLFKSTALLINWHDEIAIEITNKSMTDFLKEMFEFVKKDGIKVDHNKAMRDIMGVQKSS